MNGFIDYLLKVISILFKIGLVLFVIGAIGYFSLSRYIDYRMRKNADQEKASQNQRTKEKEEYDKLHAGEKIDQEQAEKEAAYSRCLNKAYKDYKTKYDKECSKLIMDGECIVTQEKRYELDGIYLYDKKQCEKLKQ